MIESPSRAAIFEPKPPAYNELPQEKEPLITADTDVEVTVVEHKPITSSIKGTVLHLHRIAGFGARWRGLRLAVLYHFLHAILANFLAAFLGFGIVGEALVYIFVSLGLARLHMAWTHSMIAYPSAKPWFARLPARKDCKALLLPALVYAAAQQATIILPIGVAFALGVTHPQGEHIKDAVHHDDCSKMAMLAVRILAVPVTYIIVGLAVLLPASVTLTRIEATLLPEGEETIVPFDKAAMMGDVNLTVRGGCRALFVQAWRSFDRASRWRLVKLYAKMVFAQIMVSVVALHLMLAEVYLIGGERIAIFLKSGAAQLRLKLIKAHENN